MSKWSKSSDELERDIARALVVQEYRDVDALEFLGGQQ